MRNINVSVQVRKSREKALRIKTRDHKVLKKEKERKKENQ